MNAKIEISTKMETSATPFDTLNIFDSSHPLAAEIPHATDRGALVSPLPYAGPFDPTFGQFRLYYRHDNPVKIQMDFLGRYTAGGGWRMIDAGGYPEYRFQPSNYNLMAMALRFRATSGPFYWWFPLTM